MISLEELSPVNLDRDFMIAERIADCHHAAIMLWGDSLAERLQPIRDALTELTRRAGVGAATAGLYLLREMKARGDLEGAQGAMGIMTVCAVVYDMMRNPEGAGSFTSS
jgi:hypothetical protein